MAKQPLAMVNLNLAHTLLAAAQEQPSGFLNVRGANLAHEVGLMAAAGLVDASFGNATPGEFAVINRVTEQGHAFLRAFKNQSPSRAQISEVLASVAE